MIGLIYLSWGNNTRVACFTRCGEIRSLRRLSRTFGLFEALEVIDVIVEYNGEGVYKGT